MNSDRNLREILTGIGMGQFNATMTIPYMMISPATTDPKSAPVMLMVRHIQRVLYQLGATDVADSGRLDAATAAALNECVGHGWEGQPWSVTIEALNNAKRRGYRYIGEASDATTSHPIGVGGPLDFLPDVPGGLVTYAVGAFLLYRAISKKGKQP